MLSLKGLPLTERLWTRVTRGDGCWEWQGAKTRDGYGVLRGANGKQLRAHRASWLLTFGEIPEGMRVCHHCDNPICVRPEHLFLGSDLDNAADKIAKGRDARGVKNGASKLSGDAARSIVDLYARGGETYETLAKRFGVCITTVFYVLRGHRWVRETGLTRAA